MPKGPRFKRGFTWRHHFDEWWDRRSQEWKVRLFVGMVLGGAGGVVILFLWANRWMERENLLAEAKQIHQSRIEASDKLMTPKVAPPNTPNLRNPAQLEPRASE